jgi:tRNA pseudouridine55 synthase
LGNATRVAEYIVATRKEYEAVVRLGLATDTYDAEGEIVAEAPVEATRGQVEAALGRFRGPILQVPPMYSAIKRNGVPLYRLARQGIEVTRPPRPVHIHRLDLTTWEPPDATLKVDCSKGTYVRTLAHDLGQALGCGAHLKALTRLASGDYRLGSAITLEAFSTAAAEGHWQECLQPIDTALARFTDVRVNGDMAQRICHGQAIPTHTPYGGMRGPAAGSQATDPSGVRPEAPPAPELVCVRGPDGQLLALARDDRAAGLLRPYKVFC